MSLINLGAGISAMGASIAQTAGEGALEAQRAQLETQKITLASQLAGQQYDVESKKLSLIPQQQSVDAYLKMTGHPGGLADFGMAAPAADGSAPAPAASGASPAAAPAAAASSGAPPASSGAPAPSGSSTPPASAAASGQPPASSGATAFPNGAPVVAPVGDKGKVMGLALPPGVSLQQAQIMGPAKLAEAWAEWAKPQNIREGAAITYYDFNTGQQRPLYQNPKMPEGTYRDAATNTTVQVIGANDAIKAAAQAKSGGEAQGALPAKETQAAFEAGLRVRTEDDIAQRQAYYQTGIKPPAFSASDKPTIVSPAGDIGTPAGTVVPAPPKNMPFAGTDATTKQNTNTQDTEKNFGAVRGTLDQTESRLLGLTDALKTTQGGGFNEQKADLSNKLRGLGLGPLADTVMSEKDVNAVQKAIGLQTLDVLGQLKQINQGSGGRVLATEFTNTLDRQYGPDLGPKANFDLITNALGGINQTRSMIDDYNKYAKPVQGWRDANAYVSAYYSDPHNQMPAMVAKAEKAVGPLKGMPGAPKDAPALPDGIPGGSTLIGTSGGNPVYQTPDGKRLMVH